MVGELNQIFAKLGELLKAVRKKRWTVWGGRVHRRGICGEHREGVIITKEPTVYERGDKSRYRMANPETALVSRFPRGYYRYTREKRSSRGSPRYTCLPAGSAKFSSSDVPRRTRQNRGSLEHRMDGGAVCRCRVCSAARCTRP